MAEHYEDGEVLGLDTDGCLIQWDADAQRRYNCGETPEQFGEQYLTDVECKRVRWSKLHLAYMALNDMAIRAYNAGGTRLGKRIDRAMSFLGSVAYVEGCREEWV